MVAPLYTTASGLLFHAGKILVLTVGLPARGKTHISRALERYLRWMGVKTQVVSLGDYRRKTLGGAQKLPRDYFTLGEKSMETQELRKKVSLGCEKLIWDFFHSGGQVVIYDANNGRKAIRQALAEKFDKEGIHVVYLESLCDNKEIIEANIRSVKISSPDYRGWNSDTAVDDYFQRIKDHEKYYEPVEETDWPFIRILNVGEKIMVNNIRGYLQSRIVFFLMNIHNKPRTIYFARSGQSLIEHSYKADSDLSPAGWEYAEHLKDFVLDRRVRSAEQRGLNPEERKLVIWTSTRRRSHHTAWPFIAHVNRQNACPPAQTSMLDEMAKLELPSPMTSLISLPGTPNALTSHTHSPTKLSQVTTISSADTSPDMMKKATEKPEAHGNKNKTIRAVPALLSVTNSPNPDFLPNSNIRINQVEPPSSSTIANAAPYTPPGTKTDYSVSNDNPGAHTGWPSIPSNIKVVEKPQMLEINPGIWDGLTPDLVSKYYPEDWKRFARDPYSYRAPRAESYHDLSVRLEPILIELEREQEDLLIIGHASVIRCLLAYLIGLPASEIPAIEIARGDLLEVIPTSYGVHSQAFHFWDGPGRKGIRRKGASEGGVEGKDGEGDEQDGDGDGEGEGEGEEEAGYYGRDENNFYENYAEDTRGKRKVVGTYV